MKITRDIVNDLLPAYVSGEASADTRALIEELSAADPEIARLVESARLESTHLERSDPMLQNPVSVPPNLEREVVMRTRAVLRRRSWTLALALLFSLTPFVFGFNPSGPTFWLWRDAPWSRLFLVAAAYFWFDYVRQTRRLRVGE